MSRLLRYLEELNVELRKSLPTIEASDLVQEAKAHLEDSIQARLELGATREEAERAALAAFGEAHRVGEEVRKREPKFDRGFTVTFLAMAAFAFWAVNQGQMGKIWFAWLALYAALHIAFVVKSLRVQRPQLLIFAVVLLPLWLGNAIVRSTQETTVFFSDSVGGSRIVRAEAAQRVRHFEESAAKYVSRSDELLAAYTRYVKGESDLALKRGSLYDSKGNLLLRSQQNRTLGEADWNHRLGLTLRMNSLSGQRHWENARRIQAASERPWWAELPYQLGPAFDRTGVLQILGMYGGGHILLWAVGVRSRRPKTRRGAYV